MSLVIIIIIIIILEPLSRQRQLMSDESVALDKWVGVLQIVLTAPTPLPRPRMAVLLTRLYFFLLTRLLSNGWTDFHQIFAKRRLCGIRRRSQ